MVKDKENKWENAYLAIIIVLAFVVSFLYVQFLHPKEYHVNGLTIVSGRPPGSVLPELFAGDPIVMRMEMTPGTNPQNGVVTVLASEIAGVFALNERRIASYGHIEGVPDEDAWINCVEETSFCKNERIVVKLDPCNCVKVERDRVFLLFDEDQMRSTDLRLTIRAMFNGVLADAQ
ncbi:hypothetical protein KJ765_05400 [Candidatus Micrarchaeota archaeon]|nr:hypothetical protein [Candidatus Micrarchaeota archaeon]